MPVNLEENKRILVVDDNPHIHRDFRKILTRVQTADELMALEEALFCPADRPQERSADEDYRVCFASDGREGLATVQQAVLDEAPFAMAFVDMQMPGWNGVETIERLWGADDALHIVICTGSTDKSWKPAIARLGRPDQLLFLRKPFDVEEVLRLASALTTKWLMTQRARLRMDALEESVRQKTNAIRVAHEDTIHRLVAASMYRDKETGAHIRRTGMFSELMARHLSWSSSEIETIRMAAPMHDVGKIGIPDSILLKPGRLTPAEYEIMKTHTVIGGQMLRDSHSPILQAASVIALSHHERWDGSGYPYGIAGGEIPMSGRILAIVDVFDALSQDRIYRPALPHEQVLQMLRDGSGSHFDPELLQLFFRLLPEMLAIAAENPDPEENEPPDYLDPTVTHCEPQAAWLAPPEKYLPEALVR